MSYTLYYQKIFYGDKFVVARSKNLLKLLKIKTVTYGFSCRAFIEDNDKKEKFDKFDLSDADRILFNNFEMKVNSGRYFPTYDYNKRAREHHLATL